MKTTLWAAMLFAFAAAPVFAQQEPPPVNPSTPPAASPASPQSTQPPATKPESSSPASEAQPTQSSSASATPSTAVAVAETQPVELRSVNGELRSKLDTRTAKSGDDVVIETSSTIKTADGTEIPKGSKLTGHVVAVKASDNGATSQVALNIDHAEIKGGKTLPIHSEIESVGSETDKSSDASAPDAMSRSAQASAANAGRGAAGSAAMPSGAAAASPNSPANAPGYTPGTTAANSGPAVGSIVARNGHIAIRTTSVPGVLLANNAPGEQDPRMAQASGILLGAKKDVVLDTGTKVVLGVSSTPAPADGAAAAPDTTGSK
ncbi:MAG TPA: hypothetical protein VN612_00380 [Acidobacteriaceae bacterium]|nr:hypothetical protein [Acidobacteriaceae bacterium]